MDTLKRVAVASERPVHPRRGRGKGPPETSSALAGRRKWWKGPERTKRAKSSQRQLPPASKYPSIAQRAPCSNRQTGQRVSVREIRYRKQPPTVRNTHSVLKKASWGTRRIFKGVPCQKQHLPQRQPLQCAKRPPLGGEQI